MIPPEDFNYIETQLKKAGASLYQDKSMYFVRTNDKSKLPDIGFSMYSNENKLVDFKIPKEKYLVTVSG